MATLAAPLVLAQEPAGSPEAAHPYGWVLCDTPVFVEDVGPTCPQPDGHHLVLAPDGRPLGLTHGPDAVPAGDAPATLEAASAGNPEPKCVDGEPGTYHVRVIYARAHDDADRYATLVPTIQALVSKATALVDEAAQATGGRASIRVKCAGGAVDVANEALPTPMASASFSTIISDLANKGYNDGRVKYWIFYDDTGACRCGGQGLLYWDERASVHNYNNGNADAMYAVDYGYDDVRIWLHELGHNMGAVQKGSPHSTEAGHCYDGLDTMCYDDGGPNGHLYSTSYCATSVFDCGNDDYFHRSPPSGTYLASSWNIGSSVNRFLDFSHNDAPGTPVVSCAATAEREQETTCTFTSEDDSMGVFYDVDWGDGTTSRIPASGYAEPGVAQEGTHVYANPGTVTVSAVATDSASPALSSATGTTTLEVRNAKPTITSFSCSPNPVAPDAPVVCSFAATDDSTGLSYLVEWGEGNSTRVPATGYALPGEPQTASWSWSGGGPYTLNLTATDDDVTDPRTSDVSTFTIRIGVNVPPDAPTVSCPSLADAGTMFSCELRTTDDSAGVAFTVDWGDGAVVRVPETGFVAPGTTVRASHVYASVGDKVLTVSAADSEDPPLTGNATSVPVRVVEDAMGPALRFRDPLPGVAYHGCGFRPRVAGMQSYYIGRGCVALDATDESGIDRVEVHVGGALVATDDLAPYRLEWSFLGGLPSTPVHVTVYDNVGNSRAAVLHVFFVG